MKKTRVKLDSENSLFVKSDIGTCVYKIIYDSFVLVEDTVGGDQNSSIMFFCNGKSRLLESLVGNETIEEKFFSALNLRPINFFYEEIIYINSLNQKVIPL